MFEFNKKKKEEYVSFTKLWCPNIGLKNNFKFWVLELTFGLQITELLVDTSSLEVSLKGPISLGDAAKSETGMHAGLSMFIPATLMTSFVEKQLAELLYEKYLKHYMFLKESKEGFEPSGYVSTEGSTLTKYYTLNKSMFHQLVPYRGKINLVWTVLETAIASITWLTTNSLEMTLLFTGISEFLRRFRI
ncbi:hypothetical protein OL309_002377 [Vibrio parahaemolyticus]|nr:hypothetical protein [Vibrio parahaemolyticus]HCG7137047.1 hypothetical protein [Vibrio parahaemolyticus]